MSPTGTQHLSSGPYPSQSMRYCRPLTRRLESRMARIVYAGDPSMSSGGGRNLRYLTVLQGTSYHRPEGRHMKRGVNTIIGSNLLRTLKGPTHCGPSFRQGKRRGRFRVESQTLSPGTNTGASLRWRSALLFCRPLACWRDSWTALQVSLEHCTHSSTAGASVWLGCHGARTGWYPNTH